MTMIDKAFFYQSFLDGLWIPVMSKTFELTTTLLPLPSYFLSQPKQCESPLMRWRSWSGL